jgi:hypothetical protein
VTWPIPVSVVACVESGLLLLVIASEAARRLGRRRAEIYADRLIVLATLAYSDDSRAAWQYCRDQLDRRGPAPWRLLATYQHEAHYYGTLLALDHFTEKSRWRYRRAMDAA